MPTLGDSYNSYVSDLNTGLDTIGGSLTTVQTDLQNYYDAADKKYQDIIGGQITTAQTTAQQQTANAAKQIADNTSKSSTIFILLAVGLILLLLKK